MSNLIVLAFDTEAGATKMLAEVERLQKMQLISIEDAATVVRHADGKVKVKQANGLVGAGAIVSEQGCEGDDPGSGVLRDVSEQVVNARRGFIDRV